MVLKKFNELYKEKQNYIKEKRIIEQELNKKEQELNKKEQELNKKEQELANNKKIKDNLNIEIKLLKDNDELRKLTGKIDSKDSSTPTKIPKILRKKDDKARTFNPKDFKKDSLPKYNEKSNRLRNLEEEYQNATDEKYIINLNKIQNIKNDNIFSSPKIEKLDIEQIEKDLKNNEFYKYELNISNSRIKYLDKIIKENPKMSAKGIDIINQLKSLYTMRKEYFNVKVNNPKSGKADLRIVDDPIPNLEKEFKDQKDSGTFTYQNKFVKLLTLLTQLLAKNNSKRLKDDINQILKELYNSKQITKQVYNILNKLITYK